MDSGALVPDDVIIGIIKERLAQPDCSKGFILDGVPRTVAQAEALEVMGVTIDKVVDLEVADEVIMRRLSGRRVCSACGASYHTGVQARREPDRCDRCSGRADRPQGRRARHRARPAGRLPRADRAPGGVLPPAGQAGGGGRAGAPLPTPPLFCCKALEA